MGSPHYSKAKGRDLQNRVAKWISILTGFPCGSAGSDKPVEARGMGQKGTDVRLSKEVLEVFSFSIECKNDTTIDYANAIKQAKENQLEGTDWLLIVQRTSRRKDKRYGPIVIMDAERFFDFLKTHVFLNKK